MLTWLKKNWLPAAVAAAAGAVGLMVYEKHAAAAVAPSVPAPATAQIALQPGETTVSVAKGGSVMLTLPAGASWAATTPLSPLNPTTVQPTGSTAYNIVMGPTAGVYPLNASWVDSSGNAQTTLMHIAVS